MKNLIVKSIVLLFSFTGIVANAQTMEEGLTKAYVQFDSAKTTTEMMAASAAFDLVASTYPDSLMPNYYAAYCKAVASYAYPEEDMKSKDMILDQADMYFEKVKMLNSENDETYVLGALLANARLAVDGGNRWQQYGPIFDKNLESAKALNPNNPRIYYLKGIALFFTPKMFGGGAKKALVYFEKAKPFFDAQTETSVLKVHWGKTENEEYRQKCLND
jgi:hypothetical protein